MATLQIREGHDAGRIFRLKDETFLGRCPEGLEPGHFLPLPDPQVSRRHAVIRRSEQGYSIEDLGSTNGTSVGDELLNSATPRALEDGDEIRVCSTLLVFRLSDAATSSLGRHSSVGAFARSGIAPAASLQVDEAGQHELSVILDASQSAFARLSGAKPRGSKAMAGALRRLQAMAQVSVALGAISDREKLMQKMMEYIFDIFPSAERAFVLLRAREGEELVPVAAKARDGVGEKIAAVAISRTIIDQVVARKQAILSIDTLGDERFSQRDSIIDLSIRSIMCAPLLVEGDVLGLIQVDSSNDPKAFEQDDVEILAGICAQAAIAVRNAQLYADIEEIFESFIRASVQAIESRDPVTAGHSFRVADFTERLAGAVDRCDQGGLKKVSFTPEQMREIRYAALLHDFGKVGVREHVLTKPKKLYPHQLDLIQERFRYARASQERRAYRKLIQLHEQGNLSDGELVELRRATEEALVEERRRLEEFMQAILAASEPTVEMAGVPEALEAVRGYVFPGEDGEERELLHDFEFSDLLSAQGSLSPDERLQIESHVSHTYAFLSLIPWSGPLAAVPDIAYAHHEKLDGKGYPRGLSATDIPVQSKIMTIADIYDALTAGDRPYKRGIPADSALDILRQEVAAGKLDQGLVEVFVESKSYLLAN